jgi:outer membrane lipoprotein SlyB
MGYDYRIWGLNTGRCATGSLLITAAALALAVSGCATSTGPQKYPSDWASIRTASIQHDCPNLAGTYSNRAVAVFPSEQGAAWSLSDVFTTMGKASTSVLHGSWEPIGDSASVSFNQTPDSLTVSFASAAGIENRLTFERKTKVLISSMDALTARFQCWWANGEPRLRFFDEISGYSSADASGSESGGSLILLLKAADGSLIVQKQSQTFRMVNAAVALIPTGHVSSVWYRYPPLTAGAGATAP